MIGEVLLFLKDRLNDEARSLLPGPEEGAVEDKFVFVELDQRIDHASFKLGAVSMVVFNVQEEHMPRAPEPYARISSQGRPLRIHPDLRLNLSLLFVSRFKSYDQGWEYLSLVLQYFQSHKWLDRQAFPALSANIDHLVVELMTLTVAEQSELWGLFRTTYLPSVAYRIRTLVLCDAQGIPEIPLTETSVRIPT